MISKFVTIVIIFFAFLFTCFSYSQHPNQLKVEYISTPLGIDVTKPLFSWQIESDPGKRNQRQTAYQIEVINEEEELVWDSKKVYSDKSVAIQYNGNPLQPRTKYRWRVSSWDEKEIHYETESYFETGFLDGSTNAWNDAQWIGTTMEDAPFASHYLSVFQITYRIQLDDDSKSNRASFLFGANDSRLMDQNKNIQGVQSEIDKSYIEVEFDIRSLNKFSSKAMIHIYRVGYEKNDSEKIPFKSFEIPQDVVNARNAYQKHLIKIEGGMGGFDFYIDDYKLNEAASSSPFANSTFNLNPVGKGHDYISFPMLADIGFKTRPYQKAFFSDLKIKNKREPNNTLFEENLMEYNGIFSKTTIVENAYFIGGNQQQITLANPSKNAVPHLRTTFQKESKKIVKARIYATARGIYQLYLNGNLISHELFNPGFTQYNKTHRYQTYDITDLLENENVLGVLLAEGWWSGNITYSGENYWNFFGDRQSFLGQIIITYEDGSEQIITSNTKDWYYFKDGPIKVGSFFQGEIYDATVEDTIKDWSTINYDFQNWSSCVQIPLEKTTASYGIGYNLDYSEMQLLGNNGVYVIPSMEIVAKSVEEVRPGVVVYDIGQNMVGIPKIKLNQGIKGNKITLRFAEVTYPNLDEYSENVGMIMLENIRAALAQDIYIQKGGEEVIQPRFTFHGYRFIEITGIEDAIPIENVRGVVISSVNQLTSDYKCSNENINRLWENIAWSTRSNFLSIPTDCPQRNERMGWSGDINVFSKTATYMIDASQFLRNHLLAMREIQSDSGRFTDVAPIGGGFGGTLWGSAGVVVAWETYLQYGNIVLLREHYPAMKRYVDFLESKQNKDGILDEGPLGDWLSPENSKNDNTAIWNAYQVYDLEIVHRSAEILGYTEDAQVYRKKHRERKIFFNDTYFNPITNKSISAGYESFGFGPKPVDYVKPIKGSEVDTQSSYAIPLSLGVYKDIYKEKAAQMLVKSISRKNKDDLGVFRPEYSLMTGFIGTASINEALSMYGHDDTAYKLLLNNQYPSWLYPVVNGATTIWERLNSYTIEDGFGGNNSMNSFNHYSFGAVGAWMQNYSLGIQRDPNLVAFKAIVLKPTPDPTNQLRWAEGHYNSMYGTIKSAWKVEENNFLYTFSVPANTNATVFLKANSINDIKESGKKLKKSKDIEVVGYDSDRVQLKIGSGHYRFKVTANNRF